MCKLFKKTQKTTLIKERAFALAMQGDRAAAQKQYKERYIHPRNLLMEIVADATCPGLRRNLVGGRALVADGAQ